MCHVLIIEDEAIIAASIQMILEGAGATSVDFADTEEQAVAAARITRPKVITSDVRLRVGTGPNAVKAIRDEHGHIPVIYITSSPEECHGCDPDHIVPKPMSEARIEQLFLLFQER